MSGRNGGVMRFSLFDLGRWPTPAFGMRHSTRPSSRGGEVRVLVRGGTQPDMILARARRPLRIIFRREESAFSSERVIVPAFGKGAMLPPDQEPAVGPLPEQPSGYEFICQLGMLRGRLAVARDTPPSRGDRAT